MEYRVTHQQEKQILRMNHSSSLTYLAARHLEQHSKIFFEHTDTEALAKAAAFGDCIVNDKSFLSNLKSKSHRTFLNIILIIQST